MLCRRGSKIQGRWRVKGRRMHCLAVFNSIRTQVTMRYRRRERQRSEAEGYSGSSIAFRCANQRAARRVTRPSAKLCRRCPVLRRRLVQGEFITGSPGEDHQCERQ